MAFISLSFRDEGLQNSLAGIAARAGDLTPVLTDIGESLLLSARDRFDTETDPDGSPWPKLKPRTIKAKKYRAQTGKPYRTKADPAAILKDTFTLRDSIAYRVTSRDLFVGTNRRYGIYHQSLKPRRRIPRRAFLGLTASDRTMIAEEIVGYLAGN